MRRTQQGLAEQLRKRGVRWATFAQACQACGQAITKGALIGRHTNGWAHTTCLPSDHLHTSPKARRAARRAAGRRMQ